MSYSTEREGVDADAGCGKGDLEVVLAHGSGQAHELIELGLANFSMAISDSGT